MDSIILAFLNQWVAWDKADVTPNGFIVDGDFVSRLEGAQMLRTSLNNIIEFEEREEMRARLPAG